MTVNLERIATSAPIRIKPIEIPADVSKIEIHTQKNRIVC